MITHLILFKKKTGDTCYIRVSESPISRKINKLFIKKKKKVWWTTFDTIQDLYYQYQVFKFSNIFKNISNWERPRLRERMERNTPVRKPHTSTADLLTWSEVPPSESPVTVSGARSHQVTSFLHWQIYGLVPFT